MLTNTKRNAIINTERNKWGEKMENWLMNKRVQAGLSQLQVAKSAKISQSYYSAIENGTRGKPLNVKVAKRIASVLCFDWTRFYDAEK